MINEEDADHWLGLATGYANFALDHLEELENKPEHPYSLYDGVGGLICLLMSLVEGHGTFPCFEFSGEKPTGTPLNLRRSVESMSRTEESAGGLTADFRNMVSLLVQEGKVQSVLFTGDVVYLS